MKPPIVKFLFAFEKSGSVKPASTAVPSNELETESGKVRNFSENASKGGFPLTVRIGRLRSRSLDAF